jgi:hypothetical protein
MFVNELMEDFLVRAGSVLDQTQIGQGRSVRAYLG